MKSNLIGTLLIVLCAIGVKSYLHLAHTAGKTDRPNLKPIEAGYEGKSLKQYSFGFENLFSALLWVQMLQKAQHTPVKSDEVSWEYAQLEAITTLDPKFE